MLISGGRFQIFLSPKDSKLKVRRLQKYIYDLYRPIYLQNPLRSGEFENKNKKKPEMLDTSLGQLSVKPTIISVRIRKSLGLFRILREVS